jgi:chemotaxis regulatin CheY-phosphate phosphatase CheZ
MKNESRKFKLVKSLDERFAKHPETQERLHRIADEMEQAISRGMTADEAEEMAIKRINELGRALLTDWAKARQERAVEEVRQEQPEAIRDSKKN